MSIIGAIYFNLDTFDLRKITLNDELLHVTRYINPSRYDLKFWLKDIVSANINLKTITGLNDAGQSRSLSYYRLCIALTDGSEERPELLGFVWFERAMLQKALEKLINESGKHREGFANI